MEWRVVARACTVAGDINLYNVSDPPLVIEEEEEDEGPKTKKEY